MVFTIQQKLIFIYLTSIIISVEISSQTTLSEISSALGIRRGSHECDQSEAKPVVARPLL